MSEASRLRDGIDILMAQILGYEHMAENLAQSSARMRRLNHHNPMLKIWADSIESLEEKKAAASNLKTQLQRQLDEIENRDALIEIWHGRNPSER